MPLKYTCPNCGTTHRNIDKSLLGNKVQCACGKVSRLGDRRFRPPSDDEAPQNDEPADAAPSDSAPTLLKEDGTSLPPELQPREMGSQFRSKEEDEVSIRSGWDVKNPAVNVVQEGSGSRASGSSRFADPIEQEDEDREAAEENVEDSSPFEVIEDSDVFEVIDGDSDPVIPLPATPPEPGQPVRPVVPREYGFVVLEESDEEGPDTLFDQSTPDSSVYNDDGLASPLDADPVEEEIPTKIPEATPIASQSLRSPSPIPQPANIPQGAIQPAIPEQRIGRGSWFTNSGFEIVLFTTCILTIVFAAGLVYSSANSASIHFQLAKISNGASLPWFLFAFRTLVSVGLVVFSGLVMADLYLTAKNSHFGIRLAKPLLLGSAITILSLQALFAVIVSVGASPLRYEDMSLLQWSWTFIIILIPAWIVFLLVIEIAYHRRSKRW